MTSISLIIPIYNESKSIEVCMDNLASLAPLDEIIFADGGSKDDTLNKIKERIENQGASYRVISCPKGRAQQMNYAAERAEGDILWFSHADSLLPSEAPQLIQKAVEEGSRFGCFQIDFDLKCPLMSCNRYMSNRRAKKSRIAFGDQGIFIHKELFNRIGGFSNLPIMEDYELSRRLKKEDIPLTVLPATIVTSGRRYENHPLRTMLQMIWLRHLYRKGVDINKISEIYKDVR